jgi:nicotinamidase/pyrazinamidase
MKQPEGRTALIAVDVQRDFLPGGSLAVQDGDQVIAALVGLAGTASVVIATRDFHPPDHCSFIAQGGPWPPHCVIGSSGAAIATEIDAVAHVIVSKGTARDVDAYSGFDGTGLGGILRSYGVDRVTIGGLATDYCVRATAMAALHEGFATTVVLDAVRAVDVNAGDGDRALDELRRAGITLQSMAEQR